MRHGEVNIEHADEVWLSEDSLLDTLTRERLLTEAALDVVKNFRVGCAGLVENSAESEVGRAETVAEVLSEDPARVGVGCLLDSVSTHASGCSGVATEEGVVGETVQE